MSLTSIKFFCFFIIFYVILIILKRFKIGYKNVVTKLLFLLVNYLFVLLIDYRFLICIILFTAITYYFGLKVDNSKRRKFYLYLGIVFSVLQLGIFKYFNFFLNEFQKLLNINTISLKVILPVGISFYTFSAISYIVDIYKKKEKPANLLDYSIYLSFFLKLVCGPIVKITKFKEEFNNSEITYSNFEIGIQKFVIGLFKKVVIADHLMIFVDDVYNYTNAFSSASILLAVITYSLLIYFDFSGYSDIAIGLSKILGFNFDNNFNVPYISKSPSEFWKRWHISLSSWLQEYIYIPLGGNRKGNIRTYINLFLTMLIGGIWHGANWTFILWGGINGIALCVHKLYSRFKKKHFSNLYNTWIYKFLCVCLNFVFISFTWIFFRSESIADAINIITRLFKFTSGLNVLYLWTIFGIVVLLIEIVIAKFMSKNNYVDVYYPHLKLNNFFQLTLFLIFCGLTIIMAYVGETQFIYGAF